MGGGQRQLLATCCDFPALLPTAWLMKLPLIISPLPLPGPLPALSFSIAPPLYRSCCCRSRCTSHECTADRWLYVRNASFIVMARYVRRSLSCRIRLRLRLRLRFVRSRFRGSVDGILFSFSSSFSSFFLIFFFSPSSVCRVGYVGYVCVRVCIYVCFMRVLCVSCCAREQTFSSR